MVASGASHGGGCCGRDLRGSGGSRRGCAAVRAAGSRRSRGSGRGRGRVRGGAAGAPRAAEAGAAARGDGSGGGGGGGAEDDEDGLLPLSVVAPRLDASMKALERGGIAGRSDRSVAKVPEFVSYEELRPAVLSRMAALGAAGAVYAFLVFDLDAAASFSLGVLGSCAYWLDLCESVEALRPLSEEEMRAAARERWSAQSRGGGGPAAALSELPEKLRKGLRDGLWHRRMLIPVLLAGGVALVNAADVHVLGSAGGVHLSLGGVFGGFFVLRVALLYQVWKDLLVNIYVARTATYVPPIDAVGRVDTNPFSVIKRAVASQLDELGRR